TNTVPFAAHSQMNHIFNFVAASGKTATKINAYICGINTEITANGNFTLNSCYQDITLNNCNTGAFTTSTGVSCFGGNNGTVTVAHGCTSTTSATISQPSALIASSSVVSNVSCNGGTNASISVSASGGTPPYSGTGTFTGLTAGTYSYTVTDAHGCTSTTSATITEPTALTASNSVETEIASNSGSDGSIFVTVSGDTTHYIGTGTFSVWKAGNYS